MWAVSPRTKAARPSEARLARWSEIDRKDRVWSIPGSGMKSRRPHRVPLSIQAAVLLDEVRRRNKGFFDLIEEGDSCFYGQHYVVNQAVAASQFIFPSPNGQPLSESALNIRARKTDNVTAHGMARRAFRNWAAENGSSWEVSELALAHTVGTPTSRAYFSLTCWRNAAISCRLGETSAWGPRLSFYYRHTTALPCISPWTRACRQSRTVVASSSTMTCRSARRRAAIRSGRQDGGGRHGSA